MTGIRCIIVMAAKSRAAAAFKAVIPLPLWTKFRDILVAALVAGCPDRQHLEKVILPVLGRGAFRRILFIGCESFTRNYGRHFEKPSTEYWTTDIRPEAAPFGAAGRHVTCDVKELESHFPQGFAADLILFNGVFGYGLNTDEDMDAALRAIHRVLLAGGILMLGWNKDLAGEPERLPAMTLYQKVGDGWMLPPRIDFEESTHAFAFFTGVPGSNVPKTDPNPRSNASQP